MYEMEEKILEVVSGTFFFLKGILVISICHIRSVDPC